MAEKIMKNKKGQMAIFAILAVVLIAAILLYFLVSRGEITSFGKEVFNPERAIDSCTKDALEETINVILPQGGFYEPKFYKMYNYTKVPYLCYFAGLFKRCIHQHPMLLNEITEEIRKNSEAKIKNCLESMKKEAESRNFDVQIDEMNTTIEIIPGRVFASITGNVVLKKEQSVMKYDGFEVELRSPIWDLITTALEISIYEAKYCYFEYVGYMLEYPEFLITKFAFSEGTKIYTITDKESKKTINIAVRGCVTMLG